jgi:HEAT repeat protein
MQAKPDVKKLLDALRSPDEKVRTEAWLGAGDLGARAVQPLANLTAAMEAKVEDLQREGAKKEDIGYALEVGRAAKRAIWKIVRTAGAPGAQGARTQTVKRLLGLLDDKQPVALRREALWMISEIAEGVEAADPVAALLKNNELREDARMALERIPGDETLAALKAAFDQAPEDFKYNLAQSLRKRGVKVKGYPCQKLKPTKKTKVKPAGA